MAADSKDMYRGKVILAPMVRVGGLPFRMTCLHYGADIVYAEEIIAQRFVKTTKHFNSVIGTTDFLDQDGGICFRTCEAEKNKLVFQMGVSNPELAVEAARMIEPYVSGIDVNMGCPKSYSIKGNMGAALLTQPELVKDILTALTKSCHVPITCKIRILDNESETLNLCRTIEKTGVAAIAVHGRTRNTRSTQECNYEIMKRIKSVINIPVILNGASLDVKTREDMKKIMSDTGVDSIMIARAAWHNPSIFYDPLPKMIKEAVRTFMMYCIDYEVELHILKYTMAKFKGAFKENEPYFQICRHIEPRLIYQYFEVGDYYDEVTSKRQESKKKEDLHPNKRVKLDNNLHKVLTVELTPSVMQSFRSKIAPRQILNQWLMLNGFDKPTFWTTENNRIFTPYLQIDNDIFTINSQLKNKRTAMQALAYAYCMNYHIELRHYKTGPRK